jgi:CubicO group peptidase (beta-lactamase class C family)
MKLGWIVIFFAAVAAALAPAGGTDATGQRIARIERDLRPASSANAATLAERMAHYRVPGVSVAVIHQGRIEWARAWGVRDAAGRMPATPETMFQAASISKPVAALVALRLVEQGRLALDEDVNTRLRSWKLAENEFTAEEKVTLRALLTHSAGLNVHGFRGYAADEAMPTNLQLLRGEAPANSDAVRVEEVPGTRWRYSGGGFQVLQQLLEDTTGQPFAEVAADTVLAPLGMTRSSFLPPVHPGVVDPNVAGGHKRDGAAILGGWHLHPEQAAAGLWSTPSDLARFALELARALDGQSEVLSQEMAGAMLAGQVDRWGLGLAVEGDGESLRISHGGSNVGYRCQLVAFPRRGQGAVVMTNGDGGAALLGELLGAISREYGWPRVDPR